MVKIKYKLPLLELVTGFYDNLKSISQGFASLDYEILILKMETCEIRYFG
jgi:translation elongation factor EF-4